MVTVEDHQLIRDQLTVAKVDMEYWKSMYELQKEWADAFFSLVNEYDPNLCLAFLGQMEVSAQKQHGGQGETPHS